MNNAQEETNETFEVPAETRAMFRHTCFLVGLCYEEQAGIYKSTFIVYGPAARLNVLKTWSNRTIPNNTDMRNHTFAEKLAYHVAYYISKYGTMALIIMGIAMLFLVINSLF